MRIFLILSLLCLSQPNFACDCGKSRNSDFKSQTKNFDLIVSGTMQGDNSWFSISKVYHGNISTDSISLYLGGCGEAFIDDSSISYIIGLTQHPNDPMKFSASMCVTDILVVEQGTVKVSQFNNFSSSKRTISWKRTEMKLEEFEGLLAKWL